MEEPKKLTFGFSKVIKKSNLIPVKNVDSSKSKVEMIKCLEGNSIQLVEAKTEEAPLVIPLLDNRKTSAALASLQKRREVLDGTEQNEVSEEVKPQEIPLNKDDSLESKAVRELLAQSNQVQEEESSSLVLPLKSDELPLDGAKESSMDDYDNIPINQFGLAMLRGMGWKEDPNKKKGPKDLESPFVRPKGMGLGADKAIKTKPLLVAPENNEVLEIKKNAYVKVLAGKHQDLYGQIEGLDDHAGRVIVKMALGGTKESFNEFLLQPVPKKEFQQYGKVINAEKYDKYKKMENEFGQIKVEKLKEELKKEIKSEEKWDHDKYEDHKSKQNDRNNEDRKSKRDDRDHQDDEDRRYKRDDYKYKRFDEDRRSRKDGRDDRNQRSKGEDRYNEDQRYKHDRKDNDSYRSKKDDREKRYDDRYDSRDDYRSKRDEKYEKNGDKRDDKSSRRNDYSDNKNRKDDKYSHKEESRSERRRSSSQETHKSSKHKSKKSSKHYSSDSDDDYHRSSKKNSKKKYDSDSSENDYSRYKKSSKSKRQRSRSRSRGRR